MNKAFIYLAIALFTAFSATASESFHYLMANSISATGRISATIVAPVSMSSVKDMTFGMIVKNKSGFVELDGSGSRLSSGPGLATSIPSSGAVQIKGPRGHFINVSVPESRIYDNENHALEINPIIPAQNRTLALNNQNGEAVLNIGGTLKLHNTQAASGTHKGFYVVQASY